MSNKKTTKKKPSSFFFTLGGILCAFVILSSWFKGCSDDSDKNNTDKGNNKDSRNTNSTKTIIVEKYVNEETLHLEQGSWVRYNNYDRNQGAVSVRRSGKTLRVKIKNSQDIYEEALWESNQPFPFSGYWGVREYFFKSEKDNFSIIVDQENLN